MGRQAVVSPFGHAVSIPDLGDQQSFHRVQGRPRTVGVGDSRTLAGHRPWVGAASSCFDQSQNLQARPKPIRVVSSNGYQMFARALGAPTKSLLVTIGHVLADRTSERSATSEKAGRLVQVNSQVC